MKRALLLPRAGLLTLLAAALLAGALSLFGATPAEAQQPAVPVPSNFHITATTSTSVTVAWDGVGPGGFYQVRIENLNPGPGEKHRIEREPDFIAWQPRQFTWGPRYTYTGLTTGSTYRIQARSGTGSRYGPWSETYSVTVGTTPVTPLVTFARTASGQFSGELRDSVFEGADSKPAAGDSLCGTCGIVLNIAPQLSTASTVTVVPRPGTAEAGVDYSTDPYTVELPASTSTVRIYTPVIDNILSQPLRDVSFFLELEAVDGAPYVIGRDRRFEIGPITDDDVVTVSFSPSAVSAQEGIIATGSVIIDKLANFPVTVTLAARADNDDNTANAGDGDYRLLTTEVTIPAGERTSGNLNIIQALYDGVTESSEIVLVAVTDLSFPPGGRVEVGPDPLKVTILNSYKSSLSVSPNPVAEGSSVTVTLTLSEASGGAFSLPVTLRAGTAESGDFRVAGVSAGTSIQKTVPFTATATSGSFTVTTAQDTDTEDETFTVSAPAGAEPVTVRIYDDDGGASDLRVLWPWVLPTKLAWNNPPGDNAPDAFDVHYTTDSTIAGDAAAVSGTDPAAGWVDAKQKGSFVSRFEEQNTWYTSAVKWGTEYRFRVRARYQLYSGHQRTGIRFSGWSHTSTVIGSHTAVGVVQGIHSTGYEFIGRADILVQLANPVNHEVKVDYATAADPGASNAATAGTDYTPVSGTVTFAPGETQRWVTVPIIDDSTEDSGETFRFVLSNPKPADKVRLGSAIPGFKDVEGPGPKATVTIFNHEAELKALAVEGASEASGPYASLDIGAFVPETTEYTVTVPYETTHARLTPTALHDRQRLRAGTGSNLQAVDSGAASAAIPLAVGENALVVESFISAEVQRTYTVTVTRQQRANNLPTVVSAISDATVINESGTHEVSLSGAYTDADLDALSVTASSSDENVATVSVSADYATLTVAAQGRGTATVTVTVSDGYGGSVEDVFTITVKSAPVVASAISDVSDIAVGDTRDISLSGVFSDADGDSLTVTASSSDDGKATITVAADQSKLMVSGVAEGTATITVTARDADNNQVSDAFDVTVEQAAPAGPEPRNFQVVPGDGVITVSWDPAPFYYKGRRIGDDRIKHALRWWVGSGWANPVGENGFGPNDGIHVENGVTSYTITGLTNGVAVEANVRAFFGSNYQEGAMNKGESSTSSRWVRSGVATPTAPNQAPTVASAISDATIANETGTHQVSLSGVFTDADSDALTVKASSSNESVANVSVSADYATLTVSAQGRGTATVTVTADDGEATVGDTFTVTVKAAPVVTSAITDVSGLEVEDTREVSLSGVFSDADGDSLTVTANSSNDTVATVAVAADHSGLTLTGRGAGTATITVTAQDADGNTVSDAFDVTVVQANNPPTVASAINDATIVNESGTHQASLSGVFSDADQDSLAITATSSNEQAATVSVSADYTTLTVSAQSRGTTTITVNAADGNGGSVEDTFTVTVKAAPVVASAIADVSELEIDATHEVSMSGIFRDADGDALTISAASSNTAVAQVSNTIDPSTGSATAITVIGVDAGTATITVTARDSDGNSVSDAFDVTVPAAQQQAVEVPGPVTGLTVTASAEDSVTVSWSAPESGGTPDGYIAHLRPENGKQGSGTTKRPGTDSTTVSFNNLESGQTYEVWVRAQNEAGKGERTNATITMPGAPPEPEEIPGPVIDLQLSATSDSVTVSWSAPETGGAPDGYIVHVSPEDGGKGKTKTPKAKKTSVTFNKLKSSQTYTVWVRAQNEAGKGERVHATITLPE